MDTDLWMWRRSGGSAPDCRPPRWPGAQEDRSQEPRAPGSGEWSPRTGDASSGAREQCGFFWGAKIFRLRPYSIHLISISSLLFKCFPNSRFRNWTFWFHEIHFIKNPYWVNIFLKVQFWPDSIERFSERIFNWFVGSCQWVILGTLNNNIDGGSAKILCKYSANILEPNYLNI